VVAQRRAEMERFATIVPPLYIGTPLPPSGDPMEERVLIPFFGLPVERSSDPSPRGAKGRHVARDQRGCHQKVGDRPQR